MSLNASARGVNGVCFDPFNTYRVASTSDDAVIKIWDTRDVSEPVRDEFRMHSGRGSLYQTQQHLLTRYMTHLRFQVMVVKTPHRNPPSIAWSPTRVNCLASVGRDEHSLCFWHLVDVMSVGVEDDDIDLPSLRIVSTPVRSQLLSRLRLRMDKF